jgi:VanZ family protein
MSSVLTQTAAERKQNGWRFQLWAWLPVVLAVGCIALESQPIFGADHTTGPLQRLVEWFTGPLTGAQWWHWHHAIRKCGHFIGYGVVSFTWFRAFWMTFGVERSSGARKVSAHTLAMAGTFLVASADEFHQSFLPNRTGTPWDVLLDCCGALAAQLIIFLIMLRFFRERSVAVR